MATGWNNKPVQCGKCTSIGRLEVMVELYNEADNIVVGCCQCRHCTRRYLFTRVLTTAEASVKQQQGKPIRSR